MLRTVDLFAHTIYEAQYPNFADIKDDVINYISQNFDKEFNNQYHDHDHPLRQGAIYKIYECFKYKDQESEIANANLKNIYDFITERGKEYWDILKLNKNLDPYILQLWATATKQGGFVASHNHNPVPISGVFYLNARPELGNLFLENPLDLVLGKSPIQSDAQVPTRFNHEIEAVDGRLVLFPGWMKHFTRPNPTNEIRMSMAVNFGCQGQVRITEFI